jgi:hypothetical protein
MRSLWLAALLLAPSQAPSKPAPKTITLTGCVARGGPHGDDLTLEDQSGSYRLTGLKLADFVGQRVQIGGAVLNSKKLKIEGGLRPSANVAAQAGAMDPARAAVAAQDGQARSGAVQLPEFRVKTIRPLGTGCQ